MIQPTQPAAAASARFVEDYLRSQHDATYDQVRRAASAAGLTIYPNMFGEIRKRVRVRHARPNRSNFLDDSATAPERRFGSRWPDGAVELTEAPERPQVADRSGAFDPLPTAATTGPAAMLEDFVARVRAIEAQSMRFHGALEGIRSLIDETLADLDVEPE